MQFYFMRYTESLRIRLQQLSAFSSRIICTKLPANASKT
jgi:hypothetical protein